MADMKRVKNAEFALNQHAEYCQSCLSGDGDRCPKNALYFGKLRDAYLAQYGAVAPVRPRTNGAPSAIASVFAIKHYVVTPIS